MFYSPHSSLGSAPSLRGQACFGQSCSFGSVSDEGDFSTALEMTTCTFGVYKVVIIKRREKDGGKWMTKGRL